MCTVSSIELLLHFKGHDSVYNELLIYYSGHGLNKKLLVWYSGHGLNEVTTYIYGLLDDSVTGLFVRCSDHHSVTGPFSYQTTFGHSVTGHVR